MNHKDNGKEIDFEIDIAKRMDSLIARKRSENELVIARIATLDTAWKDVNGDIDNDLKTGLDTARVEAQAVQDAKERLTRNVCEGVDKNAFGLVGKVIDIKSKIGLPGLTVKITLGPEDAAKTREAETDNYGDFFFSFTLEPTDLVVAKKVPLLIVVLLDANTVVYRSQRSVEPRAGATEHLTIAVKCSGSMKDVLEHGKQVAASVEGDAELVAMRAANFDAAYAAFQSLSETTLSQLRRLKRELSVAPVPAKSVSAMPVGFVATATEKTRFLGNSHARELHDLEKVKKQCQIDEIRPDHRVYFKTPREAEAAGYDYCAYCFGKGKSRR